jgi:O-antigen/teichoic acid export membrane protein
MRTLAVARFLQPATMTLLQLAAGLGGHSTAFALIVAHLLSHTLYSGFIFARTLHARELREIFRPPLSQLASDFGEHRRFPLFVMPANVASQLVANAPPVLLGSLFGAEVAGLCGMAYRLVSAPVAIISMSLGNVFTSEVCGGAKTQAVRALARRILIGSLIAVCLPILVAGALAPSFAGLILGAKWAATGPICFAFSLVGAAHALATPFVEITSIYHFQKLRFRVEALTVTLVFAAIFLGAWLKISALATIWLMSAAGAAGVLVGLASVWSAFNAKLADLDVDAASVAASTATP